jgi:capsular polysaccharide transport system permease protein
MMLSLGENDVTADTQLAEALLLSGRNEDATKVVEAMLIKNPACHEASALAARIFYSGRRYADVVRVCSVLVGDSVIRQGELEIYASSLFKVGNFLKAASLFRRLYETSLSESHCLCAATAYAACGETRKATEFLLSCRRQIPASAGFYVNLGVLLHACGRVKTAVAVVSYGLTIACGPPDDDLLAAATSTYSAAGYFERVIETVEKTEGWPKDLRVLRTYVAAKKRCCAVGDYMHILHKAIEAFPDDLDFRRESALQKKSVGDYEGAIRDLECIDRSTGLGRELTKELFALLVEAGRNREALRYGGRILQEAQVDSNIFETVGIVLNRHHQNADPAATANGATDDFNDTALPARTIESTRESNFKRFFSRMWAVVRRELLTRFGRTKAGYFWAIFEPLAHLGVMISMITFIGHGRLPPVGKSFALFYFTGVIPYYVFSQTVSRVMRSVPENKPLLQLPALSVFDVFTARAVLELLTQASVAAVLLSLFSLLGISVMPLDGLGVVVGFVTVWFAGFGCGLLFASVHSFYPVWEKIWGALSSLLYFSSGIFYVPQFMPDWLRNYLRWNPILQSVEAVRTAYFGHFSGPWVWPDYTLNFSLGVTALGIFTVRNFKWRLLRVE